MQEVSDYSLTTDNLKKQMAAACESVVSAFMKHYDIYTGDITPLQACILDNHMAAVARINLDVIEQNRE